jgi:alanyl-tRNA synthetase
MHTFMIRSLQEVFDSHIWQNGAKKAEATAHLDVTHFTSLIKEQEMEIENEANKIILEGHTIEKYFRIRPKLKSNSISAYTKVG